MKILFPCPGCRHPLILPRHASSLAKLRCSVCGHKLAAESIFLDSSQLGSEWEVINDSGTDNVFDPIYQAAALRELDPSLINGHVLREQSVVVPPSNEWETQSSSLLTDESPETDKKFQIANDFSSLEVGARGGTREHPTELMPDEMISVSDEPWFSSTEPSLDASTESESKAIEEPVSDSGIDLRTQSDSDSDLESEAHVSQASENETDEPSEIDFDMLLEDEDGVEPVREISIESNHETPSSEQDTDDEPELTLSDVDEFEPIEELTEDSSVEIENEDATQASIARPRESHSLPAELLGNSSNVLRSRKKSNPIGTLLSVVGGGVAAIPISILLMWYVLGKDPLSAGPAVAAIAPWIVPEKFQGTRVSRAEVLPEMPPMVGPGFSELESGGAMKLPSIGGTTPAESSNEPPADTPTEPTMKPVDEPAPPAIPEASITTLEPASPTVTTPSIDVANVAPILPEMPKPDASDAPSPAPSIVDPLSSDPSKMATLENPEPTASKIEQAIARLNKSIEVFDGGAYESGAILFRNLEAFGEQLASFPESSPERAEWCAKGVEVAEKIVANSEILKSFKQFMTTAKGNTDLFGDALPTSEPSITVDVVLVGSVSKGDDFDTWTIDNRFQPSLELRPIVIPKNLAISGVPKKIYLVIGVPEIDPDTRESIFRAILAVEKK